MSGVYFSNFPMDKLTANILQREPLRPNERIIAYWNKKASILGAWKSGLLLTDQALIEWTKKKVERFYFEKMTDMRMGFSGDYVGFFKERETFDFTYEGEAISIEIARKVDFRKAVVDRALPYYVPTETPSLEWCDIPAGATKYRYIHEGQLKYKEYHVEAFQIGKYPVTYAQFQVFIEALDGFVNDQWWDGLTKREKRPPLQIFPIANHPRDSVSWFAAVAFCRWLSHRTGSSISLPTELQWQRAKEGTDGRLFPWGNEFRDDCCNNRSANSMNEKTTPVDQYPNGVSPYGVFDMYGNVWEWCLNGEWVTEEDPVKKIDWGGKEFRMARGGPWMRESRRFRSNYALFPSPYGSIGNGFRCVRLSSTD